MDFRSRGVQSPITSPGNSASSSSSPGGGNLSKQSLGKWLERGSFALLLSITIIILAIAGLTFFSGNSEARTVAKDKYQAVFLNNGQVYFGNIRTLNDKHLNLVNIYYLQTNGSEEQATQQTNNVSLVKLGCELHAPYDQMVINKEQVLFWENLQDGSQVVKAIAQYKKDNPKGQTCKTTSQSTQQAPSSNTQTTTPTTNTQQSTTPTTNSTRRP